MMCYHFIHQFVRPRTIPSNMRATCALLLAMTALACAPPVEHPSPPVDYLSVGLTLRQRGDHLNAGYWLEAALASHPEKEAYLLHLIVEEQIQSGRLLAARSGLERLRIIHGDSPVISELVDAINRGTRYSSTEHNDNPSEVPQ